MKVESVAGLKISDPVVSEFAKSIERVKKTTFGLHNLMDSPEIAPLAEMEVENTPITIPTKDLSRGRRFRLSDKGSAIYSYEAIPFIEPRFTFTISREELQMIEQGLEPYQLDPLEEAMRKLLLFEEEVFFQGIDQPGGKGLLPLLANPAISTDGSAQSVIDSILRGAIILKDSFVEGPYRILMGKDLLQYTSQLVSGRTLAGIIEEELGEDIQVSNFLQGGLLLPAQTEDFAIEIGKELTLVVDNIIGDNIQFYLTEAFRIQYLNPSIAAHITLSGIK